MSENPEALQGGWFTSSDLKLVTALNCAGFAFKKDSEVTRLKFSDGRDSFTWHLEVNNDAGEHISEFLKLWENPAESGLPKPDNRVIFLWAREAMMARNHILAETHKDPASEFRQRGDVRVAISPRLGRTEREQLARLAS